MRADGAAQANVLDAQGQAEARLKITQAEAEAIAMIQNAVNGKDPLPYMIAMQYIKALPEMTKGKEDKMILVPYEASSLVGSLASMKKIFEDIK